MSRSELTLSEQLKIACFSKGIRIEPDAADILSDHGREPLTIHEYATTGGVTFELEGGVYVNAPFSDWFAGRPEVALCFDGSQFWVQRNDDRVAVTRILRLPGYLDAVDIDGNRPADTVMSHTDRIRVAPIVGCAYDCHFCDLPSVRYQTRPLEQMARAFEVAVADTNLPPRHVLVSGGSPGRRDREYFEDACRTIITCAAAHGMPTDIMMSAQPDNLDLVDRMVEAGVHGFAINIELYSEEAASLHIRQKHRFTRLPGFEVFVSRAVTATGGNGRVRSLILVGLEPAESTLDGVEYLASLGCDPVLSPFRPARKTELVDHPAPSEQFLTEVYLEAASIVSKHGVRLGPRCLPCQHNTLTFPRDVLAAT